MPTAQPITCLSGTPLLKEKVVESLKTQVLHYLGQNGSRILQGVGIISFFKWGKFEQMPNIKCLHKTTFSVEKSLLQKYHDIQHLNQSFTFES